MLYRVTHLGDEPTKKFIEELVCSEDQEQKKVLWTSATHIARYKLNTIFVTPISESTAKQLKDLRTKVPGLRFVIFNRSSSSQPWAIWTEEKKKFLPHDARVLFPNQVSGVSFAPQLKV
jgi:hypothetical protein